MGFEVRVNGKTVHNESAQVIGLSVMSSRGELYHAGISTEGVIDIVLDVVNAGDPIRLDQLEAAQQAQRAAIVEGLSTGSTPYEVPRDMNARQEIQDYTLREGGPAESKPASMGAFPSVDLAQGLESTDSGTLTARVNAFNEHGDAQRAVDENPAGSVSDDNSGTTDPASTDEPQPGDPQLASIGAASGTSDGTFNLGGAENSGTQEPNPNA